MYMPRHLRFPESLRNMEWMRSRIKHALRDPYKKNFYSRLRIDLVIVTRNMLLSEVSSTIDNREILRLQAVVGRNVQVETGLSHN